MSLFFSILRSPNSTEITKLLLNNNTSICLCMLFAMTSKVRKKRKNLSKSGKPKISKKCQKSGRSSALSKDLLYRKTWQVCTSGRNIYYSITFWSSDLNPHFDFPLDCAASLTIFFPSTGPRLIVLFWRNSMKLLLYKCGNSSVKNKKGIEVEKKCNRTDYSNVIHKSAKVHTL